MQLTLAHLYFISLENSSFSGQIAAIITGEINRHFLLDGNYEVSTCDEKKVVNGFM